MGNVCTECKKMTFRLILEEIRWLNKNCNKKGGWVEKHGRKARKDR